MMWSGSSRLCLLSKIIPSGSSSVVQRNVVVSRTKVTKPKSELGYEINETAKSAIAQPDKGKIYDKKPFKFTCIKDKSYLWCSCGWSKTQPFCDGTHKNKHYRLTLRPVRFIAPETKEYIFCNCKQTSKRPFCDGTHLRDDIQSAIRS